MLSPMQVIWADDLQNKLDLRGLSLFFCYPAGYQVIVVLSNLLLIKVHA